MATLWCAHDQVLDRDVAVKVLSRHLADDPAARVRFEREARAAARLSSHPHVVTIFDVGEYEGAAYIVMELMTGGSLAERLTGPAPPPRATALRWLAGAAEALDAAHAAGIVHRDVKPANMLLDEHGRLALADFGIARVALAAQLTRSGEILGTAGYLAPEQARGRPATPASDRYALAVVAFQLLTGRRPFPAEQDVAQARAHADDEPPAPSAVAPGLPSAVDPVLARGLAKDPAARWPDAGAFVRALGRALGSPVRPAPAVAEATAVTRRPVPAPPRRPPSRRATGTPTPRRPATRRTWAAPLALGALLTGFAAVAAIALSGGDGGSSPETRASPGRTTTGTTRSARRPGTSTAVRTTPAPVLPAATATAAGESAAAARDLQLAGFRARTSGRIADAVALDRRAVTACGGTRALDPCGYALFELGAALRQAGRTGEAAGTLRRRLALYGDNAAGQVSRELALATGTVTAKGRGKGKGEGKGRGRGHRG